MCLWQCFWWLDNFNKFNNFWHFFLKFTILKTCDIWDTYYNSYNWEPEFMTIFVTCQSRMTVDSIRNSWDVLFTSFWSLISSVLTRTKERKYYDFTTINRFQFVSLLFVAGSFDFLWAAMLANKGRRLEGRRHFYFTTRQGPMRTNTSTSFSPNFFSSILLFYNETRPVEEKYFTFALFSWIL